MRLALALVLGAATTVHAGGLTLPTRGMHATERAGALVAGADDADALWLDPAGLARVAGDGQRALLFDVGYLYQPTDVTVPGSPKIHNLQPGTPVFTIAGALGVGDRLVIAGGIATPSFAVHRYEDSGPQRYASLEVAGTQFVTVSVGAAYVVSPQLRVGASLQDVVSTLDWSLVASACTRPEQCGDRSYDLPLHLTQHDYVAPSGSVGVQYDALAELTLGAMVQAPTRISSQGSLTVTPPTAMEFTGVKVTGDRASATFWLPPSLRVGAEWRHQALRVEAVVAIELWGFRDGIALAPSGIALGSTALPAMRLGLTGKTSIASSLGGELQVGDARFAAGVGYETSGIASDAVSTFAIDAPKLLLGLGAGYASAGWQIGAAAGYAHLSSVVVDQGTFTQLQPFRGTGSTVVNDGTYGASDLTIGLRAARRF
jgi:long-subunit fatty acid transport protein